jgi:hypothetical protein
MTSIKDLKKSINKASHELLSECYNLRRLNDKDEKKVEPLIKDIIKERKDLVTRCNHPEDDSDPKKLRSHYQKIQKDMDKFVGDISQKIKKLTE